jgi:pullulanase
VAAGAAVGGAVFDVALPPSAASTWCGVLVHKPPPAGRQGLPHEEAVGVERLDLSSGLREVWLVGEGALPAAAGEAAGAGAAAAAPATTPTSTTTYFFTSPPDMDDIPAGSLARARAHWTSRDTILWRVPSTNNRRFFLHASASAALRLTGRGGVEGADAVFELLPPRPGDRDNPLRFSRDTARFPHLFGCTELRLPAEAVAEAASLLRCQLAVSVRGGGGGGGDGGGDAQAAAAAAAAAARALLLDATSVQTAGALDDLFATDAPLGDWQDETGSGQRALSVWAPTAQRVELLHWADGPDYSLDPATGKPRSSAAERRAARSLPPSATLDMQRGPAGTDRAGVWSIPRPEAWTGTSYKLRVTAFCPATNRVEVMEATDPYARAVTADGERCVFCGDLSPAAAASASSGMAPEGWEAHRSPPLAQWTDVSVYELHIRDFSAMDLTVPEHLRGKYLAFSPRRLLLEGEGGGGGEGGAAGAAAAAAAAAGGGRLSAGLAHLSELQRAGLTHVHLLPTFDFGSVPERPEDQLRVEVSVRERRERGRRLARKEFWPPITSTAPPGRKKNPTPQKPQQNNRQEDLSAYPPDSDCQQAAVSRVASRDAFNWGYDPVHWGVPEGSYSLDADGPARTPELREAVMALHGLGLRVVFDVVYNHTFGSGPHGRHSVLDKIVPGESSSI